MTLWDLVAVFLADLLLPRRSTVAVIDAAGQQFSGTLRAALGPERPPECGKPFLWITNSNANYCCARGPHTVHVDWNFFPIGTDADVELLNAGFKEDR